ncbi:hypothetical protein BHM03_00046487 [Ensete ventricosum]|nr:hypothetical protein BHM03_00046487 [Ensete ventricosum]
MTDKEKGVTLVQSEKEEDGSRLRAGSCLVSIAARREGCYLRLEGNKSTYRMAEAIVTGSDNVNIGAPGMVKEAVVARKRLHQHGERLRLYQPKAIEDKATRLLSLPVEKRKQWWQRSEKTTLKG